MTIAEKNDQFRKDVCSGIKQSDGKAVQTRGVSALGVPNAIDIQLKVAEFDTFTKGDDPYGEHDFGMIEADINHPKIFWKIDYYSNSDMQYGAEPEAKIEHDCYRVLTIMLADEY